MRVPEPTLRPWYVARRYELFALVALLLILFAFDAVRTAHSDSTRDRARKLRVTLGGIALFIAVVWGLEVRARRQARRLWQRSLHIAVILLDRDGVSARASDAFLNDADSAMRFLAPRSESGTCPKAASRRSGFIRSVPFLTRATYRLRRSKTHSSRARSMPGSSTAP